MRERRERLEKLLDRRNRCVRLSETFDDGDALFEAAEQQELEGIMAKRLDSRYAEGRRTRDWLKVKTHGRQEFIIAGYTHGGGRRASTFGSLILAVREGDELRYVGNVGTGFDDAEIRRLLAKLKPLRRETSPFRPIPKLPRVRKDQIVWVEPQLVAEVEFAEWTHDGHLRASVYQGLRDDKDASDVHREEPDRSPSRSRRTSGAASASSSSRTSTSRSGPTRESRRATCCATTATSRRCSCRTSRTGRSR